MCIPCQAREKEAHKNAMLPENQQKRVEQMNHNIELEKAKQIDDRIQIRSDIFNAETTAIVDIAKAVEDDASITNKPYTIASVVKERFDKFQSAVFELNQQIADLNIKQKAIQVYLNNLSNKLRAEEREKLKISDINYKPKEVKLTGGPKKIKTAKNKIDKAEVKRFALQLGIGESTLQMMCVAKNISPEAAFNMLKTALTAGQNLTNKS
jgi:hypothetical protein